MGMRFGLVVLVALGAVIAVVGQEHATDVPVLGTGVLAPDRESLVPDTTYLDAEGVEVSAIRCATSEPSAAERALVDSTLEETVGQALTGPEAEKTQTIDTYIHVVYSGPRNRVSRQDVDKQMRVLNRAFEERGFAFDLQDVLYRKKEAWHSGCGRDGVERRMKRKLSMNPRTEETVLDIYLCDPDGLLGYAWFPTSWSKNHFMHGVVALYSSVPGGGAVPYDRGDTVVHEVGHWLGLFHTFEGGCDNQDEVVDTPAEQSPARGCPVGRDSCPDDPGEDPIYNFMDYSHDRCMDHFTAGQSRRMRRVHRAFH